MIYTSARNAGNELLLRWCEKEMEHKKYELAHCVYTEDELKKAIAALSSIRAYFYPFNDCDYEKVCACKIGMDAIYAIMGVDKESD